MTDGKLEIFAAVGVETHYVAVLYRLHISVLIVKTHGLVSTPIQSTSAFYPLVSNDGMCPQIVDGSFKFTLPLYFDIIACTL
jgi:hypothetical protein